MIFPCSWDRNGIRWISLLQELFGQNAGKSSYDLNSTNLQVLWVYIVGQHSIINNRICQTLLLYGTYDSWTYTSIAYSLTPVSTLPVGAGYHHLPHQPSHARALSTLQNWLLHFFPFRKNPGILKKAKKQKKKQKPTRKRPSICWKCWATSAPTLLMCLWNFLPVLLCKCKKTMALFLQTLRNIFFGFPPYTSSFLTPTFQRRVWKGHARGTFHFTYSEIWVCTRF